MSLRGWINNKIWWIRKLYIIVRKGFPLRLWLCDVDPSRIPVSTIFPHPIGIVIARETAIGIGCVIYQNVTLGTNPGERMGPDIGNCVTIYPGAMVIGPRIIGDRSTIGAGCHIYRNTKDDEVVKNGI